MRRVAPQQTPPPRYRKSTLIGAIASRANFPEREQPLVFHRLTEKPLGGSLIALGRQEEINGSPCACLLC